LKRREEADFRGKLTSSGRLGKKLFLAKPTFYRDSVGEKGDRKKNGEV